MGYDISLVIIALMVVVSHLSLSSKRRKLVILQSEKPYAWKIKRLEGEIKRLEIQAKVAEKMAERAFSLSSSANVATSILSKSLATRPRWISKDLAVKDELAKKQLGQLFGEDESEWIKPLLNDDEIELLEEAKRHARKARANGEIV